MLEQAEIIIIANAAKKSRTAHKNIPSPLERGWGEALCFSKSRTPNQPSAQLKNISSSLGGVEISRGQISKYFILSLMKPRISFRPISVSAEDK